MPIIVVRCFHASTKCFFIDDGETEFVAMLKVTLFMDYLFNKFKIF